MAQLDDVLGVVEAVLGPDVVGAYLFGSARLGGLRPRSDLDVLVVAARPTTRPERQALVAGLLPLSGRDARAPGGRPVELTLVVEAQVRPWRYPPRLDFQYGEWLRDDFLAGHVPEPRESPDLAILLTMARAGGRALAGPEAASVLDPVPPADLRRAIADEAPALVDDLAWDTANVVLTLARAWTTLATGEIVSKDAAADWALARLPAEHRAVLTRARAIYLGDAADRWDDLAEWVRPHAERVLAEIRAAAASG